MANPQSPSNYLDFLANGDLIQQAPNIAYYLGQIGASGSMASGLRATGLAAATSGINTTETLLVKMPLLLASTVSGQSVNGTLNVGTIVQVILDGTCTSSNADVSTVTMRAGILGTTSDASIATWVVTAAGSGSAIPFRIVLDLTIRTLGASGTASGYMAVQNTGVTGVAGVTNTVKDSASAISALPTTTATWLDFSYVSAATTTTCTFQQANLLIFP